MMKRLLILLITLMLVLCVSAQAQDVYDLVENALYRIYLRTEEEDVLLGNGVLLMDSSVLLTSAGCAAQGDLYAIGADGEHGISNVQMLDDSGAALLQMATPSAATPLKLAGEDAVGLACIFTTDDQGKAVISPLEQVRSGVYHHQSVLVLSSEEGLLPGGVLTDDQGGLIGVTIAQQAEGRGAYIALDANGIHRAITRQQYAEAFLPAEAAWHDGALVISWQDAQPRSGGMYILSLSSDENSYYTHFEADHTQNNITLHVAPGHQYLYQVQWAQDAASAHDPVWGAMSEIIVPADTFTAHDYTQVCELVTRAGEEGEITAAQPSAQVLTDASLNKYLQVTASYSVSEKTLLPMAIELILPDGQFFFESTLCTLAPEKAEKDVFLLPLNELIADCASLTGGALLQGSYTLRYFISGGTAGEYAFTLGEEAVLPQKEAVNGLVKDLTASCQNGMMTLSWPAESIPEGATVDAYYLYEGNTYYVYHRMDPGETQTEIITVPGRKIMAWVNWTLDETVPPLFPQSASEYMLVPGDAETPFTLNGFTNHRLSVAPSTDLTAAEKGIYLEPVPLTREVLSDRSLRFYFQTEDTYQVSEMSEDHPMNIVLTTPEGLCFICVAAYVFDPALQESDLWLMDVSALFSDYESLVTTTAWPAGEYRILYCIDGQVAGEYPFTLE